MENRRLAVAQAQIVLELTGFLKPPIDPWKILAALEEKGHTITLYEKSITGYEGCTLKREGSISIILNSDIKNENRKRFTLGHEIGHAWLASHEGGLNCTSDMIASQVKASLEQEANAFSSELLMPRAFFQEDVKGTNPSLDFILDLAEIKYKTSATATALRFVELSDSPCAVVLSEDGFIKWIARSDSWSGFIREGRLDIRTGAGRYFKTSNAVGQPLDLPADVWLALDRPSSSIIIEESLPIPEHNQVLSILQLGEGFI